MKIAIFFLCKPCLCFCTMLRYCCAFFDDLHAFLRNMPTAVDINMLSIITMHQAFVLYIYDLLEKKTVLRPKSLLMLLCLGGRDAVMLNNKIFPFEKYRLLSECFES